MDFISNHRDKLEGINNECEALIALDHYTGWIQIFPMNGRTGMQVALCLHKLLGNIKCKKIYSDRAPELIEGAGRWGIAHELSLPGRPQSNGLIESTVGKVTRGARALLAASGLPETFWPMASMAFCFGYNQQKNKNGQSPWNLRKFTEYTDLTMPFGSYINYIPPTTTKADKNRSKFTDRTVPGVLLGYEQGYGGRWKKGYVVCPLTAFANLLLTNSSKSVAAKINAHITVTEDVHVVPGTSPWFPLIDRSHYANRTLCGIESTSGTEASRSAGPSRETRLPTPP